MKLIDKDALVAEIERLMTPECGYSMNKLLDYIDTLEVKEVCLEKEHKKWLHQHFDGSRDHNASGDYLQRSSQLDMAKHFFELGMSVNNKAQKGEEHEV